MNGYTHNIETLAVGNTDFRRVLYTGKYTQVVLMSLKPQEEIGLETHADTNQFFRVEKGQGKVVINDHEYSVEDGDAIVVPSGVQHNVINASRTDDLKLYAVYSPPHHKDGIVRKPKRRLLHMKKSSMG